jgi:beta-glucosidase
LKHYLNITIANFSFHLKRPLIGLLFSSCIIGNVNYVQGQGYLEKQMTVKEINTIDSILNVLTIKEKINLLHASSLFTSYGIERFGIPELTYADGPSGVREEMEKDSWYPINQASDSATFFPTGTALAATWNPDLAFQFGVGMGEESRSRGKDIILAPGVNIIRTPLCGRNYEYFTEDPFLNARITVGYIKGVQDRGVIACVKHFMANNQENERGKVSVEMDERTLREIYLPAFRAAVEEANVLSLMTAYNRFRGTYCAENKYLVDDILRKEWSFDGVVVSDWGGTHSTIATVTNGLDIEMSGPRSKKFLGELLLDSFKMGLVPIQSINERARRVLKVMWFARKTHNKYTGTLVSTPEHMKIAYNIAAQSVVLLKNENSLLPLNPKKYKSIAIIGENAIQKFAKGGFGAGVKAKYEITALDGLKNRLGKTVEIDFALGYKTTYDTTFKGWFRKIQYKGFDKQLVNEATNAAKNADLTILFVGTNREVETEATDRPSLDLPFGQDSLIDAVVKANPNTIIVVISGAPVNLNLTNKLAKTIVWAGFNGSEGGNALADVLLGNVNPSGKLPFTIPVKLDDSPAHALNAYPGENSTVNYKEGILVGYRWFDTKKIEPLYCFGCGQSYSIFDLKESQLNKEVFKTNDTIVVKIKVANSSSISGFETVQLYSSNIDLNELKADKELKAFKKVFVEAGKETELELKVPVSQLAWFNEKSNSWEVFKGKYKFELGTSSREIKIQKYFSIN